MFAISKYTLEHFSIRKNKFCKILGYLPISSNKFLKLFLIINCLSPFFSAKIACCTNF